jgi:putative spermidine/putrescine transport system substrate-binding protein
MEETAVTRFSLNRRQVLGGLIATPLAGLARPASSQGKTLVAHSFPASYQDATLKYLVPDFKQKSGADVTLAVALAVDAVTKLVATKSSTPPFDVALMDQGPLMDAIKQGLFMEYPQDKSRHFKNLLPIAQDKWGPKFTMTLTGIAYNPKKITTPPTSWKDLWDPKYKGRVGLTSLNSSLGVAFLCEIARLNGGSEKDIEPGFKALRDLLPNVGAISANLGAHAALFQQGEVDIAPHNFNFVATLKGRGADVEFAIPDSGPFGWTQSMHIPVNSTEPELAFEYIESAISPEVQAQFQQDPNWFIPTNSLVPPQGLVLKTLGRDLGAFASKVRIQDWESINAQRADWIDRFNREIVI